MINIHAHSCSPSPPRVLVGIWQDHVPYPVLIMIYFKFRMGEQGEKLVLMLGAGARFQLLFTNIPRVL